VTLDYPILLREPNKQAFLQVHTIARLRKDYACGGVHGAIGDFHATTRRQAMQDFAMSRRKLHQLFVDLVGAKIGVSFFGF